MSQQFYRVELDDSIDTGWFLDEPVDDQGNPIDARIFTEGEEVRITRPLTLPIMERGEPLNFHLAAFDMPVVTEQIGSLIEEIAGNDVQRIPVMIEGNISGYEILNVVKVLACVDEQSSEFERWTLDDHRPDLAGTYRVIYKLKVKVANDEQADIFRIKGYEITLIVSDTLKATLERAGVRGVTFLPA